MFARIENSQILVEVTVQPDGDPIVARVGDPNAGLDAAFHIPLRFGCRVMLLFLDGEQSEAYVVGRLHDEECSLPDSVAGVQTGAVGKKGAVTGSAPLFTFLKIPGQELLAIETNGGDMLIHSGGLVHIKSGSTIELDGTVHLGTAPLVPPTGATVGPNGATIPGTPAVPGLPGGPVISPTTSIPLTVDPPAVGFANSIVRLKQRQQSFIAVDPGFWAWLTLVGGHPLIAPIAGVPPISLRSEFSGGQLSSKHTASD